MKILIVEDYREVWDFLSRRLERRGFEVVRVTDLQEAVAKARTEAPDIILIDVGPCPASDWTATRMTRVAREDPVLAAVPIIETRSTDSPFQISFVHLLSKIEQYRPTS